ncbi:MAG: hypothetical protein ACR2QH_16460, partial [Geminicoccaceae bacterium]
DQPLSEAIGFVAAFLGRLGHAVPTAGEAIWCHNQTKRKHSLCVVFIAKRRRLKQAGFPFEWCRHDFGGFIKSGDRKNHILLFAALELSRHFRN